MCAPSFDGARASANGTTAEMNSCTSPSSTNTTTAARGRVRTGRRIRVARAMGDGIAGTINLPGVYGIGQRPVGTSPVVFRPRSPRPTLRPGHHAIPAGGSGVRQEVEHLGQLDPMVAEVFRS